MFEWKKEYSVHIRSIDAQHQKLFAIAAELHEAMAHGQGQAILSKILDRLIQYTLIHFAHEEKLMEQYAFPDLAAHKVEHENLRKQVIEFDSKFKSGTASLSIDLFTFLQSWLVHHISGTDMRYSAFLCQRNVA